MNYVAVRAKHPIVQTLDPPPRGESVEGRDAAVTEQVHRGESAISHREY